jgi:tetratricopeptide (TPR) repeat protein
MRAIRAAILLLAVLLDAPLAWAQAAAECATADCARGVPESSPATSQLWAAAASVHELKLRFVEALQRFTRAQAGTFGDEGPALLESLGSMRAALAQWDAGIRRFQGDAERLVPSPEVHVAVATVLLDRQRGREALDELDAADRLDPDRADIHRLRALAFGMMGRPEDATRALRVAASITPDDPAILYALARPESRADGAGDAHDAVTDLRRALARRGEPARAASPPAPFERVDLLRQPGGVAPIFPVGRYATGFAALGTGDYDAALAHFEAALGSETLRVGAAPGDGPALAAAALRQGQVRSTIELLEASLAAEPQAESHRLLGVAYWVDDQPGRSIEHLRTAIRLAPADERARTMLADVLLAEGRAAEAERALTQALEAGVRSGSVHYRLAQIYRRLFKN